MIGDPQRGLLLVFDKTESFSKRPSSLQFVDVTRSLIQPVESTSTPSLPAATGFRALSERRNVVSQ